MIGRLCYAIVQLFAAAILFLSATPNISRAEEAFRLQAGDSLNVSILSIPELTTIDTIDTSDTIWLPLIGRFLAGGKTLEEIDVELRRLYSETAFRSRKNGVERFLSIDPVDVFVRINEWRPVFLSGPVRQPGVLPYRPGMTVREIIVAAGEFAAPEDLDRYFRLEMERNAARRDLIAVLALTARLVAARDDLEALAPPPEPILDGLFSKEAWRAEAVQLQLERQQLAAEEAYLDRALEAAKKRLKSLEQQYDAEIVAKSEDETLLIRQRDLVGRGLAPVDRVNTTARQVALATSRALETQSDIIEAEQRMIALEREHARLREGRAIRIAAELATALKARADIEGRFAGIERMLFFLGSVPHEDDEAVSAEYWIVRGTETISADLDTRLHPGDVVTVGVDETAER